MGSVERSIYLHLLLTSQQTTNMKVSAIVAAIVALAGVASGAPQLQPEVRVLSDNSVAPVGTDFRTDFALDNGVAVVEEGQAGVEGQANHAGQFTFTAPNGEVITLNFVADERGFQPTGDHLPTPPPMPPHALEQIRWAEEQRALGNTFE